VGDDGPWPRLTPEARQEVVARFTLWFTQWGAPALDRQAAAYLDAAKNFGWEERLDSAGVSKTVVWRERIGVVAAVIPWNSPYSAALVKMIPALLAGCTVVLKASPENSLSILRLGEVFTEVGFPEGVVSILPADRETSEHLVAHPDVDKISFTGSTAAGRRIASIAGEQLKRVSLELGGKSASIILEDADLAAVAEGLKFASFANNAENCQAHTRVLAPRSRYDEVVAVLKTMVESLEVGDPAAPGTFIGPMIRADQQERVQHYIRLGIEEGARLVVGGPDTPEGLESGFYVRPTLFADVDNSMRIANDSVYGLGGGVWTTNPEHGLEIARRMQTGGVRINDAPPVFDGPFGGYKDSGIGRENGAVGLTEYVEHKTIARCCSSSRRS
jgi:aldehyde dehydrogenase (NAD+)